MVKKHRAGSRTLPAAGTVYFVGAGPGNPKLLTIRGKEIIQKADLVIYAGSLVNPQVLSNVRKAARVVDSASLNLEEIITEMVEAAQQGKTVARIHSGDPSIYSAIAEQTAVLEKKGMQYEVIPGVTSAFAAAAALKKELTVPGISQTLIITRRGGNTPVPENESLASLAAHKAAMAIFLSAGMIEETIHDLINGGYPEDTPAAVVYRASWPDERIIKATLATIAPKIKTAGIGRQAIILVGKTVGELEGERSRLYDSDFSHGFRTQGKPRKEGPAVVALSSDGAVIGSKIIRAYKDAQLFLPDKLKKDFSGDRIGFYHHLEEKSGNLFRSYKRIVFIMASGIAVRMIAPHLQSKWNDPAVVVMDDKGKNIISLLAGHWGGANQLARKLGELLKGRCIITTGSDVRGLPALDVIVKGIAGKRVSSSALMKIQSSMVSGESIGFYPEELSRLHGMAGHATLCFFNSIEQLLSSGCSAGMAFSHKPSKAATAGGQYLFVHPRDLVVGIGCNRGVSAGEIAEGINALFKELQLPVSAIYSLCTIDAKADEKGIQNYARSKQLGVQFFNPEAINAIPCVSEVSACAHKALGVHGVAEPVALLGARGGVLIHKKVKFKNVTLAVAQIPFAELITMHMEEL